jgi:hypothetical protein
MTILKSLNSNGLTELGKIQKFLNDRLVNKKYVIDDGRQDSAKIIATVENVEFYNFSIIVFVKWSGYLLHYNQGTKKMDINVYLSSGGTLLYVESKVIDEIAKLVQYIDVYKEDIYLEYV